MALPKHELDHVFEKAKDGAGSLKTAFADDERVEAAFTMAVASYNEMEKFQEKHPKFVGPSPSQAALSAWLDVMNLRRDWDGGEK